MKIQILQLCPLKDRYGYAGFYYANNQYYQFRLTRYHTYLNRFAFIKPSDGHQELFFFLNAKENSIDPAAEFPEISELTLEWLESVLTQSPPVTLDCSWTQSN